MMKSIQFFCVLFIASYSFGGQVEDIIKKMRSNFLEVKALEYSSTYELFKGHKSTSVHTSYQGYFYRDEKHVYQKIKNTEFVYGSDFFLKISHDQKALSLDLAQENINREIDLSTIFNFCIEKTAVEKEKYYSITLKYKHGSPTPFGVVKMRIDKKSFQILQLDLYYRNSQNFSDSFRQTDMAQPHLRILFGEIKMVEKPRKELFEYSNYIGKKADMLYPTGECKGYELIDNRI